MAWGLLASVLLVLSLLTIVIVVFTAARKSTNTPIPELTQLRAEVAILREEVERLRDEIEQPKERPIAVSSPHIKEG